jgi:hypothetical protein
MRTRFKVLAVVAAVLGAGTSSAAMAKYPCAPGYRYHNRVCQPVRHLGYGNPVSGAVSGEAAGAARGAATGGPVGAVVGGARHRRRRPYRHRQYAVARALSCEGWQAA